MTLEYYLDLYIPAIEDELQIVVGTTRRPDLQELHTMLAYHMGWEGE